MAEAQRSGIVEEIQYWYDRGYRQFSMLDDNFTFNKDRVIEICGEIRRDLRALNLTAIMG